MLNASEPSKPFELLIVEDDPGDVYLLRMALASVRFPLHITVLHDGEAAIQYLIPESGTPAHALPDLMLLDLHLPKKSGEEVLAAIRSDPEATRVPALVLSSSDAPKDRRRAFELGAHDYIQKQMNLDDLDLVVAGIEAFCQSFTAKSTKRTVH